MNQTLNNIGDFIQRNLPRLIGALAVLLVGFIIALIIAKVVRALLRRTNLDNRLASAVAGGDASTSPKVENIISQGIFYLLLLAAVAGFFTTLGISQIADPLKNFVNDIFKYLPNILGAAVLTAIAFFLAKLIYTIALRAMQAANFDEKVKSKVSTATEKLDANVEDEGISSTAAKTADKVQSMSVSNSVANVLYYLVLLIFLPGILSALNLGGLLTPVQGLVNGFLQFIPNLFGAAVILVIGYFIARLVRGMVTAFAQSLGLDSLAERVGLSNVAGQSLSSLAGLIVYLLILLPIIVSALSALGIEAVTRPASDMLSTVIALIPNIITAALILLISYVVGKFIAELLSSILANIGFDNILQRIGLGQAHAQVQSSQTTPSKAVGTISLIYIMIFAAIQAFQLLKFGNLADLLTQFVALSGNIFLGLAIFAAGLFLGKFAYNTITSSNVSNAQLLGNVARIGIAVLATSMALGQMGIATSVVNLAFGITLGAIGVAIAIAFGIGGQDVARDLLQRAVSKTSSK